jgi:hypothetical protein
MKSTRALGLVLSSFLAELEKEACKSIPAGLEWHSVLGTRPFHDDEIVSSERIIY